MHLILLFSSSILEKIQSFPEILVPAITLPECLCCIHLSIVSISWRNYVENISNHHKSWCGIEKLQQLLRNKAV